MVVVTRIAWRLAMGGGSTRRKWSGRVLWRFRALGGVKRLLGNLEPVLD